MVSSIHVADTTSSQPALTPDTPFEDITSLPRKAGKLRELQSAIQSILKNTDWPEKATISVQALAQSIEVNSSIIDAVKDETGFSDGLRESISQLLRELEIVAAKLRAESATYDKATEGFRLGLKRWSSQYFPTGCIKLLSGCRIDLEKRMARVKDDLRKQEIGSNRKPDRPKSPASLNPDHKNDAPTQTQGEQSASISNREDLKQWDWVGGVRKVFDAVETVSGTIPVVGSYIGAVAKVGTTIINLVQTMDENDETAAKLGNRVSHLSEILDRVINTSNDLKKEEAEKSIGELQSVLTVVQNQIESLQSKTTRSKLLSLEQDAGRLKNLEERVKCALEAVQLLVGLNTLNLIRELHNERIQGENRGLLDRLGNGYCGTRGNVGEDVTCFPGTRAKVLERIDTWIRARSADDKVLWICGMAGRGKSTIASTVATNWEHRAICATYHFRWDESATDNQLVCSIAKQLGMGVDPEIRNAILGSVRENNDIVNKRLDDQFRTLLLGPLAAVRNETPPVIIIVDGLDECGIDNYAISFIRLLQRYLSSFPQNVKFLLTSRPELPLIRELEPMEWLKESLDSVPGDAIDDIQKYLAYSFGEMRKPPNLQGDWPPPGAVTKLAEISQGLFQWARTAINYIKERSSTTRLKEILQYPEKWSGVDDLYCRILANAVRALKKTPNKRTLWLRVLATIVAAPHPVSLEILAFLHVGEEAMEGLAPDEVLILLREEILGDLNALLFVPEKHTEPILLMHTSIRDLLIDRERCAQDLYWVDLPITHYRLAEICLGQMNQQLAMNIANLRFISQTSWRFNGLPRSEVSEGLKYCCRAWDSHLVTSQPSSDQIPGLLSDLSLFSEMNVLFWLEVMSLVNQVGQAATTADHICEWISRQNPTTPKHLELAALWRDLHRFVTAFQKPISFDPLQIYVSALPQCPAESIVGVKWRSFAKTRIIRGMQVRKWASEIWARATNSSVRAVAFSPDARLLAVGCESGEIFLVDPKTGRSSSKALTGHSSTITSLSFSSTGRLLASGADDCAIRLWSIQTGKEICRPAGHSRTVQSVCFSPDDKLLASASSSSTIRLWDSQTGAEVGGPFMGHTESVMSICFSPDGKLLASGSYDDTIRLWDPSTGDQIGEPLAGHRGAVMSVQFSPDGKILASGSADKTVRFWDPQSGCQVGQQLGAHSDAVTCVCFSPNGSVLASASRDYTVRTWDHRTGKQVGGPFIGHDQPVMSVAFSPDGLSLASGSSDRTVRLWDPRTGIQGGEPCVHPLRSVGFSPDGKLLACGSYTNTIQVWDSQLGSPMDEPLSGHEGVVMALSFSSDGKLLVSGSSDGTIRLWNHQNRVQIGEPLVGRDRWLWSVSFSSDDKVVKATYLDGRTLSWRVDTRTICDEVAKSPSDLDDTSYSDQWVTVGTSRLLWLPERYSDHDTFATSHLGKVAVRSGCDLYLFDCSEALTEWPFSVPSNEAHSPPTSEFVARE